MREHRMEPIVNLAPLDFAICLALLLTLIFFALKTTRYTTSVTAFLAANRSGGRYVVAIAKEMAALSIITLVWYFEVGYQIGYTQIWWGLVEGPALIVMALTGWVIYRFRETRALTIAQFLEMRYSRNFRVFAGIVAFISGIINFGIFPAVEARFLMTLCDLPERFSLAGLQISTFPAMMLGMLAIALAFVFLGGLLAIMVTDCIQGIFAYCAFSIIIIWLLGHFGWGRITETLLAQPPEHSLVQPFDIAGESSFNPWYYLIAMIILFYGMLGWQGASGYNAAPRNAHEAKMANILAGWRFRVLMLVTIIVPICVHVFLEHPDFAATSANVHAELAAMPESDRSSARAPLVLAAILPVGMLGLTVATMFACFLSTNNTYLHSWGSILVQDVILPFRRRPFNTRNHLTLLRVAIFGVAAFVFCFSAFIYEPTQYVAMFLALTGAVFVGGAGSVIIGGLYWKRGTTAGAWAAMLTGMSASAAGIIIKQLPDGFFVDPPNGAWWSSVAPVGNAMQAYTGQELTFFAIVSSVAMYIVVSLLTGRTSFDLDRLLHRGKYAIAGEHVIGDPKPPTIMERLGFTREFSGRDRIVTYLTLAWPLFWTAAFVIFTIYNIVADVPSSSWMTYWKWWTMLVLGIGMVITIWFSIGAIGDIRTLFRDLRNGTVNASDDGRVIDHQAAGDPATPAQERSKT